MHGSRRGNLSSVISISGDGFGAGRNGSCIGTTAVLCVERDDHIVAAGGDGVGLYIGVIHFITTHHTAAA